MLVQSPRVPGSSDTLRKRRSMRLYESERGCDRNAHTSKSSTPSVPFAIQLAPGRSNHLQSPLSIMNRI